MFTKSAFFFKFRFRWWGLHTGSFPPPLPGTPLNNRVKKWQTKLFLYGIVYKPNYYFFISRLMLQKSVSVNSLRILNLSGITDRPRACTGLKLSSEHPVTPSSCDYISMQFVIFTFWQQSSHTIHHCNENQQLLGKSDVWLTVHRNSVWIRKTN